MVRSVNFCSSLFILTAAIALNAVEAADAPSMPGIAPPPIVKDDGTITVPSFELPFSSFASQEAIQSYVHRLRNPMTIVPDIVKMRQISDEKMKPQLDYIKTTYPTNSTKSTMDGVPVEIFVPTGALAPANKDRVLIQLHGGGFTAGGGGQAGALESIPIASVGRIKVVAVDYRLGPENHFPAASEDVASVYRELLKAYKPENIGIYGCSAGGVLSAESIAWFLKEKLPLPGAIGVICASLHTFGEGDSAQIQPRLGSVLALIPPARPEDNFGPRQAYFAGTSTRNPLAVPGESKEIMRAFPPTLFLTGTRAPEMSAAAQSHLELIELGVKSELLLFDGMDHGFYSDAHLPESQRAYKLIVQFFAENLGKRSARHAEAQAH